MVDCELMRQNPPNSQRDNKAKAQSNSAQSKREKINRKNFEIKGRLGRPSRRRPGRESSLTWASEYELHTVNNGRTT